MFQDSVYTREPSSVFTDLALWSRSVIELPCPSVCLWITSKVSGADIVFSPLVFCVALRHFLEFSCVSLCSRLFPFMLHNFLVFHTIFWHYGKFPGISESLWYFPFSPRYS